MTQLEALRKERNLTQAKLGAMANIHPATISSLEKKSRNCWPALRKRISTVLGVAEPELFDTRGWLKEAN